MSATQHRRRGLQILDEGRHKILVEREGLEPSTPAL
jgi:hypothetical protein